MAEKNQISAPFQLGSTESAALLSTFLELVQIDSPSGEEAEVCRYLNQRFLDEGFIPRIDQVGNLIVDIPACGVGVNATTLVISGHMDVVPPCLGIRPRLVEKPVSTADGELLDTIISSDNTTVLGADDKSGLAVMLEAVFLAHRHGWSMPSLRLIFTIEEETGLRGAKELAQSELDGMDFVVTFDHTGEQGVIIHQAPTYIHFTIECQGISSHAGIKPEDGVSAVVLASRIINRLRLGRLDEETTANIGTIHGGKADNVVPDRVVITGELRGHNQQRLGREIGYIETLLRDEAELLPGSQTILATEIQFYGYSIPENHEGLQKVARAAEQTGLVPRLIRTNGGSDNNIFIHRGLDGVVLSAGYVDPHALTENVSLYEMTTCARFLLNIIEGFSFSHNLSF